VHQLLPTGRCSLQNVADVLGMHPRTLQRELRSSGADFRGIVDRTRRELVTDYLLETRATLSQVSAMLGYSDQAAFNNAFQRWYGVPPGRWRKESK
jgi:AraC-like DNA-binding protein